MIDEIDDAHEKSALQHGERKSNRQDNACGTANISNFKQSRRINFQQKEIQNEQKLFRLFSALLLVTLILSACGTAAPAPEDITLKVPFTIWRYYER